MDSDEIKKAIRAGWDAMSESYQVDSDISLDDVHYAPFARGERYYRLLGDVEGKRVLELACGAAQNSIALTKWRAQVVALDISPKQLAHARSLKRQTGLRFDLVAGDMESPTMFENESFDIVLSAYGWEFVPDIAECVAKCASILKHGGQLLMATVHPLSAFDWNAAARALTVTDYFSPPVEVWEEPVPDGHKPGLTFFRTMEELTAAITDAGLLIERLLEPYPADPVSGRNSPYIGDYWADHLDRLIHVPFGVVISARKP